ncbi:sirtuin 5 [Cystobasidium minutum MCA 4210]|uniref:sirtuin 5 n=1 Tax=Cystobasidium minutum MCA 4210 TaxID=1397322 RepID=UPI0034CE71E7|eukprot:jgi/Rhomi1/172103/fgenesh1_kg.4_\
MPMASSDDMTSFQAVLKESKNIIAVCGAGLSAASGIPTFRGAGGLWRKYDAMSLATPEAFRANPSRCWAFYEYRRRKAVQAHPNDAHRALAKYTLPEQRKTSAPACTSFNIITQNVDGLSWKAFAELSIPDEEAKKAFYEMHGCVLEQRCTKCNSISTNNQNAPLVPALSNIIKEVESNQPERSLSKAELPKCEQCDGLLRPNVVWFGETPKHLNTIYPLLEKTDLMLVIGTSSTVYPAAGFAAQAKAAGAKVAVFNLEPSPGDDEADFVFYGPCEETLPRALAL